MEQDNYVRAVQNLHIHVYCTNLNLQCTYDYLALTRPILPIHNMRRSATALVTFWPKESTSLLQTLLVIGHAIIYKVHLDLYGMYNTQERAWLCVKFVLHGPWNVQFLERCSANLGLSKETSDQWRTVLWMGKITMCNTNYCIYLDSTFQTEMCGLDNPKNPTSSVHHVYCNNLNWFNWN